MIIKFEPDVTKEYILSKLSDEEIIEHYVGYQINYNKFYMSEIREEKTPSFTYLKTKDKVLWRDWGKGLSGDCFDLLMIKFNRSFNEILKLIYNDLISHKKNTIFKKSKILEESNYEKFKYKTTIFKQPFTPFDISYWNSFNINLKILNLYNVNSVFKIHKKYKDLEIRNYYSYNNPIYCYDYSNLDFKVYKPLTKNKKDKFYCSFTNKNIIEGYDQLPYFDDLLIITKSLKDVMCLYSFGYSSISLNSEHSSLSYDLFYKLLYRFPRIIIFYDNDEAGIYGSTKISKEYNLDNIMIDKQYGVKDISEYCLLYGQQSTSEYLKSLIKVDRTQNCFPT